jgi:hypothetical protein
MKDGDKCKRAIGWTDMERKIPIMWSDDIYTINMVEDDFWLTDDDDNIYEVKITDIKLI